MLMKRQNITNIVHPKHLHDTILNIVKMTHLMFAMLLGKIFP